MDKSFFNKTPKEIFGDNPEREYKRLATLCHPDLGGSPELFKLLEEKWFEFQNPIQITFGKTTFQCHKVYDGDVSQIFESGTDAFLKVSKHPSVNKFLTSEYEITNELCKHPFYSKYLQSFKDKFEVKEGSGKNTVLLLNREKERLYSVAEILEKHGPLDFRDAAWMLNRVMDILLYVHVSGFSHNNITPENVLVRCSDHGGKLVGFTAATKCGSPPNFLTKKYVGTGYYPPELESKKSGGKSSDIYMLGKLAQKMIRKTDEIYHWFDVCFLPEKLRPDYIHTFQESFVKILEKYAGPKKFRVFSM